jgi:fructose/tagatose bisphosphate aldolase
MLAGVRKVASIKSLGLTSVMFDDSLTTAKELIQSVRRVGFDAHEYRPVLT